MPRDKPRVRLTTPEHAAAPALAGLYGRATKGPEFCGDDTESECGVRGTSNTQQMGWRCPLRNTRRQHALEGRRQAAMVESRRRRRFHHFFARPLAHFPGTILAGIHPSATLLISTRISLPIGSQRNALPAVDQSLCLYLPTKQKRPWQSQPLRLTQARTSDTRPPTPIAYLWL